MSYPAYGGHSVTKRTKDQDCLANDESRSVMFIGHMAAGLQLEIGDNPDNLCLDDYASILLTQPLAAGEGLCVPRFEQTTTASQYRSYFRVNNGLQGKVSRYQITLHASPTGVRQNSCDAPRTLVYFEGNSCTQDVFARKNLSTNSLANLQAFKAKSGDFTKDEIRSFKVFGPSTGQTVRSCR